MADQQSTTTGTAPNMGMETPTTDAQTCANCGMEKADWHGNNGQGFRLGDKTYCCQGCATGTGCTRQ